MGGGLLGGGLQLMKLDLTGGGVIALAGLAVVGLGAWWIYSQRGAIANTAAKAADAVNPASQSNLVNRSVSAAGAALTGQADWSLGGQLAEWFSPSVRAANDMNRAAPVLVARPRWGYEPTEYSDPYLVDPYSPFMAGA